MGHIPPPALFALHDLEQPQEPYKVDKFTWKIDGEYQGIIIILIPKISAIHNASMCQIQPNAIYASSQLRSRSLLLPSKYQKGTKINTRKRLYASTEELLFYIRFQD